MKVIIKVNSALLLPLMNSDWAKWRLRMGPMWPWGRHSGGKYDPIQSFPVLLLGTSTTSGPTFNVDLISTQVTGRYLISIIFAFCYSVFQTDVCSKFKAQVKFSSSTSFWEWWSPWCCGWWRAARRSCPTCSRSPRVLGWGSGSRSPRHSWGSGSRTPRILGWGFRSWTLININRSKRFPIIEFVNISTYFFNVFRALRMNDQLPRPRDFSAPITCSDKHQCYLALFLKNLLLFSLLFAV